MYERYKENLCNVKGISFVETDLKKITPWMMDIILESKHKKNKLIAYLEKNLIETRIFYPPIHRLSPYKNKDMKFEITSKISDRGIWLPSSVTLKENDVKYVCKKIKNFFE